MKIIRILKINIALAVLLSGTFSVNYAAGIIYNSPNSTASDLDTSTSGDESMVLGGEDNHATGVRSTIISGLGNENRGRSSVIVGGEANKIISNDNRNTPYSDLTYSFLGGGAFNTVSGIYAATVGGSFNSAVGDYSFASGGGSKAIGKSSIALISGEALGENSVAIGNKAKATGYGSIALGDNSVADRLAGTVGYLAKGRNDATWKSTQSAISIGDRANNVTRQLTGVAAGTEDTDAVNVAQLKEVYKDWSGMGAQAAALGALKPVAYDPLKPTQFMIGYGYYNNASALALGISHYKNESTMLNMGLSKVFDSDSHLMFNVGGTWKFGYRSYEKAVSDRYKGGPISAIYVLEDEMSVKHTLDEEQSTRIQRLEEENKILKAENKAFKEKLNLVLEKLHLN